MPPRIAARLAQPAAPATPAEPADEQAPPRESPAKMTKRPAPAPSRFAATTGRQWSAAEKADMNRFLDELAGSPKEGARANLGQQARAMAQDIGREMGRQDEHNSATLELRPEAVPPDPFSLEMYVDGMIRRLNRSAAYVQNDPRSRGVRNAAIQFRLNPDGSLKSFTILNEGDQAAEIAFIRSVVERSIPFAPFPPDIGKAAKSLAMTICIQPTRSGQGGFGFSRTERGRSC